METNNKLDLAELIMKYGTENFQDFEGFSDKEERDLLIEEIKKCSEIFRYDEKTDDEYIQTLCDIVLIKLLGELYDEEFDIKYYLDKVFETMARWDNILTCRYLLKSGIDWIK